ncbi:MAG: histidine phosphatase family protein [Rubricoccaceae bacterium]
MTPRVHLLRHGLAAETDGRCVGRTDAPLAPEGHAAFEGVAARWPLARPARLVASPLRRARASAEPLALAWNLPLETDDRLAEIDFGRWEGHAWADIEAGDGETLRAWMEDWTRAPAPGGEAFSDVRARVAAWLDELAAHVRGDVVAVAHAGTIRAALVHVLGLEAAHAFRLDVHHAALTTLRLSPPGLVYLNRPL